MLKKTYTTKVNLQKNYFNRIGLLLPLHSTVQFIECIILINKRLQIFNNTTN